ncbi:MAG TPA: methylated-DNA--[protein]-cysteine S-methyltransferase [Longimicrobiales bacterium]|nr:methylated-DNA--[protein]-cysteine S-methyltransferase [Longimicrobiales bacterium]
MGTLALWATPTGLRRLGFHSGPDLARPGEALASGPPPDHVARTLDALRGYFAGEVRTFDLPLDLHHVTAFQRRVYERLQKIPYGHVVTYGDVARDIGESPGAARAVGQAVGANPVAIVTPCHRVVASDGSLAGYGGGLTRKATLLRLEGVEVEGSRRSSKVHPEVLRLPL